VPTPRSAVALVACATLAACAGNGGSDGGSDGGATSIGTPSSSAPSQSPSPSLSLSSPSSLSPSGSQTVSATPTISTPPPGQITLAFAGDVHFAGRLEPLLTDPAAALLSIEPQLSAADVTVLNLETAITERGREEPKQFHFRAPATALQAFAGAGVDVLSMANNHGVDYGAAGLQDTLAAVASSPVPVVGIGRDAAQAFAPAVVDVRGTSVAVLGATQVPDRTTAAWSASDFEPGVAATLDPARLLAAVEAARANADVVVVYLHWGIENTGCPDGSQQTLARQLSLAGADVVVGTHAHQLQGAGWLPVDRTGAVPGPTSTYIGYGLGNFVWWRSNDEVAVTTGVLTLTLDGRATSRADWTPMRIGDDGLPVVQNGAAGDSVLAAWNEARTCSGLSSEPPP